MSTLPSADQRVAMSEEIVDMAPAQEYSQIQVCREVWSA
jgi:hypothetical protein